LTQVFVSSAQCGSVFGQASSVTQATHRLRSGSQKGVNGDDAQSSLLLQEGTQWNVSRSQARPALPQFSELMHSTHSPMLVAQ
jgi:hypothetical protein